MTEEEKNKLKEKAFEIVKELKGTNNIFLPKNAELKGKLIAELESIVTFDIQEKVKKTLNRPILFVGDVYKSMLAGCYAHCVRKVEFTMNLITKRLDEFSIKHFGNPVENFEMVRQTYKDLSEIEGEFIFKDCFGQPIEKLWYGDDPAYCHTSILNPNWNTYTQNTGIKNWIELYRLGKTLFLVCLEGKDSNECKEFVKNIRDMNYPEPAIPNKLIVHTNDINKLPGYFPEPFEVIRLDAGEQVKAVDTPNGNVFCWRGGTWEITFDEKKIRPKDSKGLRYIHHLIHNKNKTFYCLDLINVTSSIQSEENKQVLSQRSTQLENEELDERLQDGIPSKQLKHALELLNQKLESTESQEERENIQEKIDQVTERIEIIQGEGSADNARVAVYNAIDRAFVKIKKEIPSLYEHLKSCLKTGASFKYEPTKAIQWTLE